MESIRLNKYLSQAGVLSRRQADQYVNESRIKVNGQIATMGMKVSDADVITVDGVEVHAPGKERVLLAFYKPVGIVCTSEKREKNNLVSYLKRKHQIEEKLIYVGRLDKDSEGLLLLSTDGELANQISKARNYHEKEYIVRVNKRITEDFLDTMRKGGIPILDDLSRPCNVVKLSDDIFSIILTQGLNRQIRRMCKYCGYEVKELKRIRVMNIKLGDLKEGQIREVSKDEMIELKKRLSK